MRDSVLVLTLFGVLTAGFVSLLKYSQKLQHSLNEVSVSTSATVQQPSFSSNRGDIKNESTNHRSRKQNRHPRKSEGAPRASSKGQYQNPGIPSVYETPVSGTDGRDSGLGAESESLATVSQSAVDAPETKVVAGVPIALWVNQNKNRLREAQVSPEAPQGLRVFVGCLEIKNHPELVNDKQCSSQLAREEVRPNGRLIR